MRYEIRSNSVRPPRAGRHGANFCRRPAGVTGEPTAFDLAKDGNQYVGVQSKDKGVQIRSEKSFGTLTPSIWFIVYYDPDATFKATQLWLQRSDEGLVWKVRLWAAKLRNPTDNAKIGGVYISAADGKVIRTDLHINSVD